MTWWQVVIVDTDYSGKHINNDQKACLDSLLNANFYSADSCLSQKNTPPPTPISVVWWPPQSRPVLLGQCLWKGPKLPLTVTNEARDSSDQTWD